MAADYPGIAAVLEAGRQTFDSWRYFETAVGEAVAQALIDTHQARNLGKAARVILDEAETVGLGWAVNLQGREHVRTSGDTANHRQHVTISVEGHEAPLKDDPVPAPHNPTYPFPFP